MNFSPECSDSQPKWVRLYLHLLCNKTLYFAKKRANVSERLDEHPVLRLHTIIEHSIHMHTYTSFKRMVIIQNILHPSINGKAMIEYSKNEENKKINTMTERKAYVWEIII